MAIGAYMALRNCSEDRARGALIHVARGAEVGLGAASQALLALVGDVEANAEPSAAREYWRKHLASSSSGITNA